MDSRDKRTGLVIGAAVLAIIGAVAVAAGITGIVADQWKRDGNGYFSANAHRYSTDTRAIATEKVAVGDYVPTWLAGKVRLGVAGDKPVFVGIAPKKTVDAYLARIDHDEATHLGFDPFGVTYAHHAGTEVPGPPAAEPFWTAKATGEALAWKLRSGDWSIVVMNADGSPGVAASIDAGVKVPTLLWAALGLTLFGLALLAAAGAMLFSRSRGYRGETAGTAAVTG